MDWKIAKWPVITRAAQETKKTRRERRKKVVASSATTAQARFDRSNTSRSLRNPLSSVRLRDDPPKAATTVPDSPMKKDPTSATEPSEPWKDIPGRCGNFYFEDLSPYEDFFNAAIPSMTSILLARSELRHVRDRERANVARLEYLTTDRLSILDDLANQVSRELSRLMSVDITEMTHEPSEEDGVEESAVDSGEESE